MSIKSTYPYTKTVSTLSVHQMVQTITIYLNPEQRPHGLNHLWRPRLESFVTLTRKILLPHLCRRHWIDSSTWPRASVRVSSFTFLAITGTSSYTWPKCSHVLSYPWHLINTFTVPSVSTLQSSIDSTRNLCKSYRTEFWTAWDTNRSGPPMRIIQSSVSVHPWHRRYPPGKQCWITRKRYFK